MKAHEEVLRELLAQGGSDLHFKANVPVYFRVRSDLVRQDRPRPSLDDVELAVGTVFSSDDAAAFRRGEEVSGTFALDTGERFRVSALTQRGSPGLIFRHLPTVIPPADDLGLPEVVRNFPRLRRGLVVVTGPARSGKSTTMAAVLREYGLAFEHRIVTLENPVEYHVDGETAMITQRQIGTDTRSFRAGLAAARHIDPDVLVFGELPDADTLFDAMALAGSGVLVYLVMPAATSVKALERMLALFPISRRDQVLTRLSISLRAVYCQHLVDRADGGRVPAFELLVPDAEVRQRIKAGHLTGMGDLLDRLRGCFSFVSSVKALLQSGTISKEEAVRRLSPLTKGGTPG